MQVLHSSQITALIPDWAQQLATLTRLAWSDQDGHCWFPYLPLTTQDEWLTHILRTDRGGALPPTHFHILPELLSSVQQIITLNTSATRS